MVVGLLLMTRQPLGVPASTPRRVDAFFRRMQLLSAAAFSLMHGANDAQKTMGIMAGALFTGGFLQRDATGKLPIPVWVELIAYTRDRPRHAVRRLAHHQDDGHEDHEAAADRRLRRRDGRGAGDLHRDGDGDRHQHDAHDHRRHRRRRFDAASVGGALGRRRPDRVGVAADDSGLGAHRRDLRIELIHLLVGTVAETAWDNGATWTSSSPKTTETSPISSPTTSRAPAGARTSTTPATRRWPAARRNPADLVILDVMLPGLSGLEVCRALRADKTTAAIPIIMLTARAEESDRIIGLEIGADDYISKPFSPNELVARVRALMRRSKRAEPAGSTLAFGPLVMDLGRHTVLDEGREVKLTAKEFMLLQYLLQHRGRVLSRDLLLGDVWGYRYTGGTRTVDVHVRRLREKLPFLVDALVTVKQFGYKLVEDGLRLSERAACPPV